MTLRELQEQRESLLNAARARLGEINSNTDESRTAELEEQHDSAIAELDKLDAKIKRLEDLDRRERIAEDARKAQADAEQRARESRRPAPGDAEILGARPNGGEPSYREAFHAMLRAKAHDHALAPEAAAILREGYQKTETRAQTTTDAAGGYMIPEEMANIVVRSMLAWGPMYDPGITQELVTTGGGAITMPTVNDTAVTAGAHTEGATLTDDGGKDVTFGVKTLGAYAFDTEWIRVSKELADDSYFAVEQLLGSLLGERLGRIANSQLTVGTGSDAPNGIVTASSEGVTAAGTAALTSDEIIDFLHSVDPAYRQAPTCRFMFNDTTLAAVRKLKDGDGNYLWQMGNVQAGTPGSLLGYGYSINQAMDSLAAAKKVMTFGDMNKYYVRKVGGILVGAIQDKDFWPGFGMAGYIRFDGELADTAAVKHLITAAS